MINVLIFTILASKHVYTKIIITHDEVSLLKTYKRDHL